MHKNAAASRNFVPKWPCAGSQILGTTCCPPNCGHGRRNSFRVVHFRVVSSAPFHASHAVLFSLPFPIFPAPVLAFRFLVVLALTHSLTHSFLHYALKDQRFHRVSAPIIAFVGGPIHLPPLLIWHCCTGRPAASFACRGYLSDRNSHHHLHTISLDHLLLRGASRLFQTPRCLITRLDEMDDPSDAATHMTRATTAAHHSLHILPPYIPYPTTWPVFSHWQKKPKM